MNVSKESDLKKFDEDDRFIRYHPIRSILIFNCEIDRFNCEINISKEISLEAVFQILEEYLEWLSLCEDEVTGYFQSKLGEDLPDDWFKKIEVYHVDISILSSDDFGATICFGESVLPDHIAEFNFEKYEITEDILNG